MNSQLPPFGTPASVCTGIAQHHHGARGPRAAGHAALWQPARGPGRSAPGAMQCGMRAMLSVSTICSEGQPGR